eukprot:2329282-Pyramimonas_sp.AAC.1
MIGLCAPPRPTKAGARATHEKCVDQLMDWLLEAPQQTPSRSSPIFAWTSTTAWARWPQRTARGRSVWTALRCADLELVENTKQGDDFAIF